MKGESIRYSAAELQFIESHCSMSRQALRAAFVERFDRHDVSAEHIKSLCSRRHWSSGKNQPWSYADDRLLRELYPDTATADVARRVGRTLVSVYARAKQFGLEKSATYLASAESGRMQRGDGRGAATRYKKGCASATKGLRRPGWSVGRMRETQFKKGTRGGVAAAVYKPIGFERVHRSGYVQRKIHDGLPMQSRWRFVHVLRWEELNGPVPDGHALKCLGDKLNTEPSNWTLVPRGLLPRLNGRSGRAFDRAPAALKPTIMAIAKLEHAAAARSSR